MAGTLFVVATPIGNLEDITLRALRTLREVDLIAAEDTRRTAKLLAHYNIQKPVVSFHAHTEHREAPKLIERLRGGISIALVSDAGTPAISDPGEHLVRLALEAGIKVRAIPGPSAVVAALSTSGLPASQFAFLGFPPRSGREREAWMESLAGETRTTVFFESPHRIGRTLADAGAYLANRQIMVHREITKLYEELVISPHNTGASAVKDVGEFVVVVGPSAEKSSESSENAEAISTAVRLIGCMTVNCDFGIDEAVALAASATLTDPTAVRKAWKKHRISEGRRRDALS